MLSIADQATDDLGGRWSILERQRRDHMDLDRMLEELPRTSGADREVLVRRMCRLVFSHAFAEEAVLWPALRRSSPDGEELTARVEQEHQEITELVAQLDAADRWHDGKDELLDRVVALLRQDVRDEEDLLLPRLQQSLDHRQLRRLGLAWELVRRTAPTRAHPHVARRPVGNVLSALPLSVLDRTRDGLDSLQTRTGTDGPAGTLSRALGAVASRVEMLSPLRRGERPETRTAPGSGSS